MTRFADAFRRLENRTEESSDARIETFVDGQAVGTPWGFTAAEKATVVEREKKTAVAAPAAPLPQSPASWAIGASDKLSVSSAMPQVAKEQYRRLAAMLLEAQTERGLKVVMVTSALPEEGKTLTATNLALTLSDSFQRQVALVDADLRRPSVTRLLSLDRRTRGPESGNGHGNFSSLQVQPRLSLLAPSKAFDDPMGVLAADEMRGLLESARAAFDWVVVDSAPALLLPDASVLASVVDGAVVVVSAGSTSYLAVQKAVEAVGRHRVLGVVLNRAEPDGGIDSDYGYGYYARYRVDE